MSSKSMTLHYARGVEAFAHAVPRSTNEGCLVAPGGIDLTGVASLLVEESRVPASNIVKA
jgi:hypothetical protein